MKVDFKNNIGVVRELKVGFSWTLLFFGGIPFFFRGMPVHAIAVMLASVFSGGIVNIIMAFIGNKMTARHYLENGYAPFSGRWDVAVREWGVHLENIPTDFSAIDDGDNNSVWRRDKMLFVSAFIVAALICVVLAFRFYDKKRQEEEAIQAFSSLIGAKNDYGIESEYRSLPYPPNLQRPRKKFIGPHAEPLWQDYLEIVKKKIEQGHVTSHTSAGSLGISLEIKSDGSLMNLDVIRSSGDIDLDASMVKNIREIAPFPAFTEKMAEKADVLNITQTYTLAGRK